MRLGEWNTSSNIDCDANGFCADEHIDITIQHVILHPEYSQQSKENDIAIVRLAHAISEFTSECLSLQISIRLARRQDLPVELEIFNRV